MIIKHLFPIVSRLKRRVPLLLKPRITDASSSGIGPSPPLKSPLPISRIAEPEHHLPVIKGQYLDSKNASPRPPRPDKEFPPCPSQAHLTKKEEPMRSALCRPFPLCVPPAVSPSSLGSLPGMSFNLIMDQRFQARPSRSSVSPSRLLKSDCPLGFTFPLLELHRCC